MSRRARVWGVVREAKHADAFAAPDDDADTEDGDTDAGQCLACDGSGKEWDGARCMCCGGREVTEGAQ